MAESVLAQKYLKRSPKALFWAFALAAFGLVLWAWWIRDLHYIEAESGVGYALGIIGVSLMLILLLYPLRKRLRFMQTWLTLRSWFRLHMMLGVLGPACILLHCNFQLGSTNSNVALFAMLLVAGSGLIGRYLYGKIHFGLYGQQVELAQLKKDLEALAAEDESELSTANGHSEHQALYLGCTEIIATQERGAPIRQVLQQRRWLKKSVRKLRRENEQHHSLNTHYLTLSALLGKLAGLRLSESLFSLWHIVHIPVFLLMIATAVVHVLAVHWY